MSRRKMQIGVCRLCKKNTELSFEHIPPKVAFNKSTKYRTVPFVEYMQNSHKPDYKPSGKILQGGMGEFCLCRNCNSFLGSNYVPSYYRMALIGKHLLQSYKAERFHFTGLELSPLKLLKQVLSMFVCINTPEFTNTYPDLLAFIKNPEEKALNERFRVYMYLNNVGKTRTIPWMIVTNRGRGFISEITFPPLGFVLSIDNENTIPELTEITHFKNVRLDYCGKVHFKMNVLPTFEPIAADYRTQEEIEQTIRESQRFTDSLDDSEFKDFKNV